MASPRSSKAPPRKPASPATPSRLPLLAACAIVLFVLVCYWPLTRFYLAQDDFVLLERADHGIREALSPFFNLRPGQFRPITKGFYFLATWPAFGLNPVPYHVVSILLHALNAVLVGAVLRRLDVSRLVSWLGAVVFAAHLCHLEAIAWASCVQQLIGGACVFAAMMLGLDALAGKGRRSAAGAAIAYALALGSYEQTIAAPFVLIAWQCLREGGRAAWRAARGPLLPMLGLFGVYAVYAFVLRGMPDSGPYVMGIGSNVRDNLRDYTGLAFSFWHQYPAYGLNVGFAAANAAWIGIILLHLVLRSPRALLFGCLSFVAFLGPVLFTTAHTHSFHLYVPAIGVMFLLASAADSVARRFGARGQREVAAGLIAITLVLAIGSPIALRKNTTGMISEVIPLPRIFVLRRAVLAERMLGDIRARADTFAERLILMYPTPELKANWRNVQSALGSGSGVRLFLERPGLDVVFVPPATLPVGASATEVMVFTEFGNCYTVSEWQAVRDRLQPGTGQ
jgi:hypothetical protein